PPALAPLRPPTVARYRARSRCADPSGSASSLAARLHRAPLRIPGYRATSVPTQTSAADSSSSHTPGSPPLRRKLPTHSLVSLSFDLAPASTVSSFVRRLPFKKRI